MEKNNADEWLKDLPVQAENPAFKPEEMILCAKCRRTNPPTRLACFYCGAPLEISEAQSKNLKPNLRKLEIWEKGFNLILTPDAQTFNNEKSAEIAKLLNISVRTVERHLDIARADLKKEFKNDGGLKNMIRFLIPLLWSHMGF